MEHKCPNQFIKFALFLYQNLFMHADFYMLQETEDGLLSLISLIGCSITVVLSVITFVIFIILWRYVEPIDNSNL